MNSEIKNSRILFGFAILVMILIFNSCSSVKYISDNKYLLNKVELKIDEKNINREEALSYIKQKSNYKVLGLFKFHMFLYNISAVNKPESWLKRIGEPPQIYDELLERRSKEQLKQYFENKGFYRVAVNSELKLDEEKRKANLIYRISAGQQYKINEVRYKISNPVLENIFMNSALNEELKPGIAFDNDFLDKYRLKIADLFRNQGYYYFTKDEIKYLADSTKNEMQFDLDVIIGTKKETISDSVKTNSAFSLHNFTIEIIPAISSEEDNIYISDTISDRNIVVNQLLKSDYKKNVFERSIKLKTDSLYRVNKVEQTFNALNRLKQFRFIDIQFEEAKNRTDSNRLNSNIRLAPMNKQATSFDIEGTNSSGNMGIAGNINYLQRNLFGGAEIFQLRFRGAIERQQRLVNNVSSFFNTREFGIESNLIFPKLAGPGKLINSFSELQPRTVVTAGYNFQRRPEYTRTIANLKLGYEWVVKEHFRHTWNIVDFNMVNLFRFDEDFINSIRDLYIKSSFTDHLILAMNYSLIFNNQKNLTKQDYRFVKFNVESAGNLLNLLSKATNATKVNSLDNSGNQISEFYRIFNTRYAQYFKTDLEYRYGHFFDKYSSLVGRAFLGIGLPFGNFDVLPFEKKYFSGGANGIRAWNVRSLGPGTYKAPRESYPNQSSDIKIEANLEYRFNIIRYLDGALFMDAGNIWAYNKKDNRPGSVFYFNKFYKQIALGTGAGFRFDFTYFIFRFDLGMKLRDPSQELNNGWIVGYRKIERNDFALSFAIGYPF